MVVVAHCTRWSRAVIRELPGRGRVRVMCVDTGVSELVHWTALRRLKTKFTVLRALVRTDKYIQTDTDTETYTLHTDMGITHTEIDMSHPDMTHTDINFTDTGSNIDKRMT